jgi:hypothetical protein
LLHVDPAPHALPQLPQLLMSEARLLQPAFPQQLCPIPHATPVGRQPHCPFEHTVPATHCVPQLPQFCASIDVSTHTAPQHLPGHCAGLSGQMVFFGIAASGGAAGVAQPAKTTAMKSNGFTTATIPPRARLVYRRPRSHLGAEA